MSESDVEKKFKKIVKQMGGLCIKFTPLGERGWPDRIVVLPGDKIVFVELKDDGKEPSKLQYYRLGQLHALGTAAIWGSCPDQLKLQLEEVLHE